MPKFRFEFIVYDDFDYECPYRLNMYCPNGDIDTYGFPTEQQRNWALARVEEISLSVPEEEVGNAEVLP